jgi:TPP-dependent pyruvate/acetoin dehydrogenase alpha subunit
LRHKGGKHVARKGVEKKLKTDLTDSDLVAMYRLITLTREFEMRMIKIHSQKGLVENPHLCIGEEAIGVGSCFGLRKDDFVIPSLRGRSVFISKGVSPSILMAGAYGKATGPSKGKYPPHHMGDLEKGIIAASLVIGSQVPLAAGAGLAFKMIKKTDQVCLCFYGDGASNRGDVHESLNLAAIFRLPVIFICENNGLAMAMPVEKSVAVKDIASRAQGYGIPGKTIDGNDVLEVYDTVQEAVERARRGEGPTLIECKTHRHRPHCERFRETRSKEELKRCLDHCPIKKFKSYLLSEGVLQEGQISKIERGVKKEIDQAVRFAEESPMPEPEEIFEDVYADGVIRGGRLCMR